MTTVPSLPKETAYLYARFNKIKKIRNQDFAETGKAKTSQYQNCSALQRISSSGSLQQYFSFIIIYFPDTLRRIDLTGNLISEIEDGAFSKLSNLEELSLAENRLTKLPMLPNKLVSFNANSNKLKTQGVKSTAFKVSGHINPCGKCCMVHVSLVSNIDIACCRNSRHWHTFTSQTTN